MELELAIVLISCVTIVAILGAKVGLSWVHTRGNDPKLVEKRIRRYQEEIQELEQDVKHWKGKANQAKQLPKLDIDSMPTDDAGLTAIVEENLPAIAQSLPGPIGKLLLGNKEKVIDFVKANPQIIERFLNRKGTEGQPAPDVGGIPQFNPKDAV